MDNINQTKWNLILDDMKTKYEDMLKKHFEIDPFITGFVLKDNEYVAVGGGVLPSFLFEMSHVQTKQIIKQMLKKVEEQRSEEIVAYVVNTEIWISTYDKEGPNMRTEDSPRPSEDPKATDGLCLYFESKTHKRMIKTEIIKSDYKGEKNVVISEKVYDTDFLPREDETIQAFRFGDLLE